MMGRLETLQQLGPGTSGDKVAINIGHCSDLDSSKQSKQLSLCNNYIINKPRRPTNPPKQAHCSLRTRRGAAESGSKAAVGLLRWIGGSRGLLIINITSRVRGKVSISIYGILCKGGLRDLK